MENRELQFKRRIKQLEKNNYLLKEKVSDLKNYIAYLLDELSYYIEYIE